MDRRETKSLDGYGSLRGPALDRGAIHDYRILNHGGRLLLFSQRPTGFANLFTLVTRGRITLVLLVLGISSGSVVPTASADESVAPGQLQASRRGATVLLRKFARPALIDHLVLETEPVELEVRDLLLLEAFLTANSRPRRLPRDEYYSHRFAQRGTNHDDPVNLTLASSANVNRDEWQRLRTHLLFNRALMANKAGANQ